MVCLPVLVFLFAVECQAPSDTELPMCSQAMCSAVPHRLLVAGEGGGSRQRGRDMATSRWEHFLPFTCPVHHVSPAGGELSQVSPLLESTALIHSRRESPGVL